MNTLFTAFSYHGFYNECLDVLLIFIILLTIDLNKIIHSKVTQIITSIFGWQFTHHFHLLLLKCNLRRIVSGDNVRRK